MPVYKREEYTTSDNSVFDNETDAHEYEVRFQLRKYLKEDSSYYSSSLSDYILNRLVESMVKDSSELADILTDYINHTNITLTNKK